MKKKLITRCKYAHSTVRGNPLYTDVYVIVDERDQILWHESLFLCELAKSSSLNTVRGYASDLLSFITATEHVGGWRRLGPSKMSGYINGELHQSRGYSPATLSRHIETLKRFYDWLCRKGYLEVVPDFDWSYAHLFRREPTDNSANKVTHHSFHSLYIDHQTFKKILAGIPSDDPFIIARDELALRLGYECGTRAHEVLRLDAATVRQAICKAKDENNGAYATSIVRLQGKGGTNRDLHLVPSISEAVDIYLKRFRMKLNNGKGPLLCTIAGSPIKDEKYASVVFRQACQKAEIARSHHQGYHRLRKSFGTHLVDECYLAGTDPWVEVPRRMGHKNREETKRYIQFDALRNRRSRVLSSLSMDAPQWKSLRR